jgi:hypothetical protein
MIISIDNHDDQYASMFNAIVPNDFVVDLIYKTKGTGTINDIICR